MLKRIQISRIYRFPVFVAIAFIAATACIRRPWVILLDLPTHQMSQTDRQWNQSRVRDILVRRLEIAGARRATVELKDDTGLLVKLESNAEHLRIQSLLTQRGRLEVRIALGDQLVNPFITALASRGMTIAQFSDQVKNKSADPNLIKLLPKGSLFIPTDERRIVIVDGGPLLTGSMLEDVTFVREEGGGGVSMKWGPEGRQKLEQMTQSNIGKNLVFILDGTVLIMPIIRTTISDGYGMIEGKFTIDDLMYLTAILKAGEMPIQPRIVSVH